MRMLGILIVLGLLVAACGGGSDDGQRLLRIDGDLFTEEEARQRTRTAFAERPLAAEMLCSDANKLTALITVFLDSEDATPTPVEEARPDDSLRIAAIIQEECERIGF